MLLVGASTGQICLHFSSLWEEKIWSCRHRAGGKQQSTGLLHLDLQICRYCFSKKKKHTVWCAFSFWRYRPDLNWRMRVLQTLALPLGHGTIWNKERKCVPYLFVGAGDEARTRYLHLGKVALYRMSYTRILVPPVGIEPTTRGFSVRCSTY